MQPFITWSVTFTLLKLKFESKGPARVLRGGAAPGVYRPEPGPGPLQKTKR